MGRKIFFTVIGIAGVAMVVAAVVVARRAPERIAARGASAKNVRDYQTEHYAIHVDSIVDGLSHPWSLAFLPDGDMLITERGGTMRRVHNGTLVHQTIDGLPRAHSTDQEGLLDIALHPKFVENGLLYFTYSKEGAEGTTIVLGRGRLIGDTLVDVKDVFVADNWSTQNGNIGSRIAFLRDGTLLMTTGDRHLQTPAQDQTRHWGKVLRLRDDGSVPADNPFAGNSASRPEIFSTGHRNPQGLAVDPASGAIYETEHGPQGGDELNLILPGRNYGWPTITYGKNYDDSIITNERARDGMEQPLKYWVPSIAPSGLVVYTGDRFPDWRGNLFLGAMAQREVGTQLYRVDLSTRPPHIEGLLKPLHQRIRDVRQGPDGLLYLLTDSGDDRLLRISPAEPSGPAGR
jgi:glucose/arabinose dehydrogenase